MDLTLFHSGPFIPNNLKRIITKEIKKRRTRRNEELRIKFLVTNDNCPMPETERKYEILRQLRIRLDKS